jgi:organic radical activating enzyme
MLSMRIPIRISMLHSLTHWLRCSSTLNGTTSATASFSTTTSTPRCCYSGAPSPRSNTAPPSSEPFEFGNILFSGPCNQRCYFCIGHELAETENNLRLWPLHGMERFVARLRSTRTPKVIFTGTRTDPQLYKHEQRLIDHLRAELPGVHLSLHTNGLLATRKLTAFNSYDSATVSLNSFDPEVYRRMHGVRDLPDLDVLMREARIPVKLSCVLTEHNRHLVDAYLQQAQALGVRRLALRYLFNAPAIQRPPIPALDHLTPARYHQGNPVYELEGGLELTHWLFDTTTGRSLNLFSDGTLSEHYLLAKAPDMHTGRGTAAL